MKKKIAKIIQEYDYESQETYDIKKLMKDFNEKAINIKRELETPLPTSNCATLQTNLNKIISIINDLKDYEVVFLLLKTFINLAYLIFSI